MSDNVISLASERAAHPVHASAPVPAFNSAAAAFAMERQQAIENALNMALFYVRTTDTPQGIRAAMVKAIRAATMLKQACTESTTSGRA